MDEAVELFRYVGDEAIELQDYEAIKLYAHMAKNTEGNIEFGAELIYCGSREHSVEGNTKNYSGNRRKSSKLL